MRGFLLVSRPCLFLVRPGQRLLRFFYFVSRLPVLPLTASASSEGGPNDPSPYRIKMDGSQYLAEAGMWLVSSGLCGLLPCFAFRA